MDKDGHDMNKHEISSDEIRPDPNNPNWTIPRTYGVWELRATSTGNRYRYGNYPVRGVELASEHGTAKLIFLYTNRAAAKSYADSLN